MYRVKMIYIEKIMKFSSIILACWLQFVSVSYAALKKINMDSGTCGFKIYNVDTVTPYEITWTGKKLPTYCKLSFISRSKELYDEYKVCAEVKQFNITACDVSLKYYEGYSNTPVKSYSCGDRNPAKHCAPEDTYFDVEFDVPLFYTDTSSKVVIRMTSVQTKFDTASSVGAIIGYSILGIGGASILLTICIVLVKRRQRTPGTILHPPNPAPVPAPIPAQGPTPYNPYYSTPYAPPPSYDTLGIQQPQQGIQNPGFSDYNPHYEALNIGNPSVAHPADFSKSGGDEHYYASIHLNDSSRPNPTAPASDTAIPQEQNFQGPPT